MTTREQIARYFDRSQDKAAQAFGLSLKLFKNLVREAGIPHWPYRQLRGLKKLEEHQRTFPGDYIRIPQERIDEVRRNVI